MSEYKISVVVPIYNAEKTIQKCVDSVLKQSLNNIQIILVNDGSVDNTASILEQYIKNSGVKIIHQSNGGVSKARNRGIEEALGKYLFFLDADDYIEPEVLEKMWWFGEKNELDLIVCNHTEFNATIYRGNRGNDNSFLAHTPEEIGKNFSDMFPQSAVAKLFKKSLLDEFHIRFPIEMCLGEDMYFTYSYLLKIKSVGKVADCFYNIQNVNPMSLSKRYVSHMERDIEKQTAIWNEITKKYPGLEETYYIRNLDIGLSLTDIYFNNFYKFDCPLSKDEKKQRIHEYIILHKDRIVSGGKGMGKPKNLLHKVLVFVIKSRNVWIIDRYYESKERLKKKKFEKGRDNGNGVDQRSRIA